VPTFAESGYPEYAFMTWQAVVGPAGMPKPVVQRLNAEIVRIMAAPDVKERFASFGTDAASSTPEELGRFLAEEVEKIAAVAKSVGATTN
jgi:tripartite-type tricarboxylate transporter receptor subunit TctC